MTSELADEDELIRSTFPIFINDEEEQQQYMEISYRYSERGHIVHALHLKWYSHISLYDFVEQTCCNEYKLPLYLKESITFQLLELIRERQTTRNDQIVDEFYYEDDEDDWQVVGDDPIDHQPKSNMEEYSSFNESNILNIDQEISILPIQDISKFYRLFHSSYVNQIYLVKIANDLRCAYQDKIKGRETEISEIQKVHRDGMEQKMTMERNDELQVMVLEHMKQLEELEEKWNEELRELYKEMVITFWTFVSDLDKEDAFTNRSKTKANLVKSKDDLLFPAFRLMEPRGKQFELLLRNELQGDKYSIQNASNKFGNLSSFIRKFSIRAKKKKHSPKTNSTTQDPWTVLETFDAIDSPQPISMMEARPPGNATTSSEQEATRKKLNEIKRMMKRIFRDGRTLTDIPRLIQTERFHCISIYKKIERIYLENDDLYSPYDDSYVFIEDDADSELFKGDGTRRLCGRVFIIYTADMSDCICRNFKKDEEERDCEEDYILFKARQTYNLYQSRLSALVVNCCIQKSSTVESVGETLHQDVTSSSHVTTNKQHTPTLTWAMRDMERIRFEANHAQGPDFHFPSFDEQIRQVRNNIQERTGASSSIGSGNENSKDYETTPKLGDYFITKHSNLSYANLIFHLVSQTDYSSSSSSINGSINNSIENTNEQEYEQIMNGYSKIMDDCKEMGVRNLGIQVPLSVTFKHPKLGGNLPTGDTIIMQIRDLLRMYLTKQKEHGAWYLPNLFLYCPKNPKHSSGDFQCQCHYMLMQETDNILHHSSVSLDSNGSDSSNENDNLHKYIVEPFYKSFLNSNVQLPPAWIKM
ncbi:hypothetical protein C9374_010410 [Naegleria lovaniensis]|uniref:Uncharacterized protein n=1 Tax=Naegleria lovaniensis TaxID=51637 RepID=A0AA88GH95_NAELO|nr:uncharacterized protein C9374_010410 [Naegleria lovaniensis]KAG2374833.1 hypothetical protein C9374_010410 [Naegleria lovaniensis]